MHSTDRLLLALSLWAFSTGASDAHAKGKLKATLLCGALDKGQIAFVVPSDDGRKITRPIACAIRLDGDSGDAKLQATIVTERRSMEHPQGQPRVGAIARHGNATQDFEAKLLPGDDKDFAPCQPFLIHASIGGGGMSWEQTLTVDQRCDDDGAASGDKPAPAGKPKVTGAAKWANDDLAEIPEEARAQAQALADSVVSNDRDAFAALVPDGGVKVRGKALTADALRADAAKQGVGRALGMEPMDDCDEDNKHCKWGAWNTLTKSKKEFWTYSQSTSGYGWFQSFVFEKKDGKWVWVAIKKYDTGEP